MANYGDWNTWGHPGSQPAWSTQQYSQQSYYTASPRPYSLARPGYYDIPAFPPSHVTGHEQRIEHRGGEDTAQASGCIFRREYDDFSESEGHGDSSEYEEEHEDRVDQRCYHFFAGLGEDEEEPEREALDLEDIERRHRAFLPQWNTIDWQTPARNPPRSSVSPRASVSPNPSYNRAPSVISISSSASDSSVEFLGESLVTSSQVSGRYSDATLVGSTLKQEEGNIEQFQHAPALVGLVDNLRDENISNEGNKRNRPVSVEFLFEFRRNVRPRQQ